MFDLSQPTQQLVAYKFITASEPKSHCSAPDVVATERGNFQVNIVFVTMGELKSMREEAKLAEELGLEISEHGAKRGFMIPQFFATKAEAESCKLNTLWHVATKDVKYHLTKMGLIDSEDSDDGEESVF